MTVLRQSVGNVVVVALLGYEDVALEPEPRRTVEGTRRN